LVRRHVDAGHVFELEPVVEALAGVDLVVDVDRDERDLAAELAGELVPGRQLLRTRVAPVRADGDHEPLALQLAQLERLAARILRDVELGDPVADLQRVGGGGSSEEHQSDGQRAHGGWTGAPDHRFTASSSSIHMSKYRGPRGASYFFSLR